MNIIFNFFFSGHFTHLPSCLSFLLDAVKGLITLDQNSCPVFMADGQVSNCRCHVTDFGLSKYPGLRVAWSNLTVDGRFMTHGNQESTVIAHAYNGNVPFRCRSIMVAFFCYCASTVVLVLCYCGSTVIMVLCYSGSTAVMFLCYCDSIVAVFLCYCGSIVL